LESILMFNPLKQVATNRSSASDALVCLRPTIQAHLHALRACIDFFFATFCFFHLCFIRVHLWLLFVVTRYQAHSLERRACV
jgi:hypothetical protein